MIGHLQKLITDAGLRNITAHTLHKNGRDYPVFLITARFPFE